MKARNLLASIPFIVLQACNSLNTVTTHDTLLRSSSRLPLPLGPVHVPPKGPGLTFMGSLSIAAQSGTEVPVRVKRDKLLFQRNEDRDTFDATGPSNITVPAGQISAQGSIFLSENFRIGAGIEGASEKSVKWAEIGLRFGDEISFEGTMAIGSFPLQSDATWEVKTTTQHRNDRTGVVDTTFVTIKQQDYHSESREGFFRIGMHLACRQGGPLGEFQIIFPTLLAGSPSSSNSWSEGLGELGAGWSEPTRYGTATGYVRTVVGYDDIIPVVGVQWTGEFSLF